MKNLSISILFLFTGLLLFPFLATATPPVEEPPVDNQGMIEQGEQDGLQAEAVTLLSKINQIQIETAELLTKLAGTNGDGRMITLNQISENQIQAGTDTGLLVENVLSQDKKGLDTAKIRQDIQALLATTIKQTKRQVQVLEKSVAKLQSSRETVPPEELAAVEEAVAKENTLLDETYGALLACIHNKKTLGLDAGQESTYLSGRLSARAKAVTGYIDLALEESSALQVKVREAPEDADLQARLGLWEGRLDGSMSSLTATVDMMDELGLETAEYRQLMIQVTGDITADIFDTKVAMGLFQKWLNNIKAWAVKNGPGVIFKLLLFLVILYISKVLSRLTRKVMEMSLANTKAPLSKLMQDMFTSVVSKAVLMIGLLVALSQLGIELAPLLAGLGIAGFIVGFALQDVLSNFAAGLMILSYRPFDVGDLIDAGGVFGKVSHMSLVSTTMLTIDNQTLVVPNSKIWGDVIKNVTAQRIRRVDMVFGIAYSDDIPHAEKVLMTILEEHEKVLDEPERVVRLHNLGDSSVDFIVRPWVKTDDYWEVYWDITREVKMRFDREGINIPFPQRDVHFYEEKVAGT